jgi:hypothetical protein
MKSLILTRNIYMRKILGLLLLISGIAMGQEMDTLSIDTAKKVPTYFGGVYLEMGGKLAPNPPGVNLMQFFGAGIQYNRWSTGFLIYNFKGTTQRFLIFPNVFELEYRYGGPFVSFNLIELRWIAISVQATFAHGDMTWRNTDNQQDQLRDEFNMTILSMTLETGWLRFASPYFQAGYQQMSDLDLSDLENSDFSGFFFGVGFRVGYFNQ